PDLETLSRAAGLSPSHLHRVFKSLTGVTPKAYAAAHRHQRVRRELAAGGAVTAAIYSAGFNSSGRFYATSAQALGMRPKDIRHGGAGVTIRFAVQKCSLGSILVAATSIGICAIALGGNRKALIHE